MKKLLLAAGVVGGMLFLATDDVSGHGGSYRGPGDSVPPTSGPGPGTGGPSTGGPTTPGPGGPSTPGPTGGPSTPGSGPGGPGSGGGGPRGPVSGGFGGKKGGGGEGFEQWQFWWENNKDRYLDLRNRLGTNVTQSGSAGFLLGMGTKVETVVSKRPTAEEVNQQIVPIIKAVLGEDDADIVDSAVLALGRMVRSESAGVVLPDLLTALGNKNLTVQQSAVLSLGVLGSVDAVPTLIDILNDTANGRQLLNERGTIQSLHRAFAAVSLGFIGSPETIEVLKQAIEKEQNSEIDIRSSSILALGLFKERQEEIVQYLVELLKDEKMDRTTRAQIPISLGRLGAPATPAILPLLKLVKGRKTDIRLEESAIIALGQLAQPEDGEVLDTLYDLIKDGNNEQSRHFAFIALAQIGGRAAADPELHAETLGKLNKFLLNELTSPKKKTHQPWAGLSLALLGREYDKTAQGRVLVTSKLEEAFNDTNNPSYKSAFAIGLGLLNARSAAEGIYKELLDTNDLNLKGYLAVSLGMMRYTEALESLRRFVLDNRDPKMRLQMATSLGLMGDVEAVPLLVEGLKNASTLNVVSSMAKALGLIGDKTAIQPIQELIQDKRAPGLARAFGCVAIGLIGEKTDLPWNVPLSENTNYRTVVPALYEILDIL